ncbi:MAG: protoporphyrinogen oxidase [Bacteroidota bacterium]
MSEARSVVVVGGGISGLTAAHYLRRGGVDVTVLERDAAPGGTMQTIADNGWLVETGPNSALETTPLFNDMFESLGLVDERVYAHAAADKRYILRDGTLHPLPMSPPAFVASSLWSVGGKLRLLKEPFVGRAREEETVAEFVERRLGREFLEYAINPFVAGVYAGDPERLSVRAAFPKLYALEERYGGLIRGMIGGARERKKRAEKAKDRARMFSFRRGMQTLPRALAGSLGDRLRLQTNVTSVDRMPEGRIKVGFETREGRGEVTADAVVIAVPAYVAERFVRPYAPSLADALEGISYPPVAQVFLGYPAAAMTRPLDGFGYLIPARERRKILGTIWSSALFPGRAPSGHVALTTFVGGSRQPDITGRGDEELVRLVASELASIMGVKGDPAYHKVIRWQKAIPQYALGYLEIMNALEALEGRVRGLHFCSNFRGGIAVGDCVMSGERIARRIIGEGH